MIKIFLTKHKALVMWLMLGLLSFIVIVGCFIRLSDNNVINVDLPKAYANADGMEFDGISLVSTTTDPKLIFSGSDTMHYIDVNISGMTEDYLIARLYYSDVPNGFSEEKATSFYLVPGFNEIKVKGDKYLRLDLTDKKDVSLLLDGITLRSAPKPLYTVTQGGTVFAVIWLLLYFLAKRCGVRYLNFGKALVTLAEGIFVSLMTLILTFALNSVRYKLITYALIPLVGGAMCLIAKSPAFKYKINLKFFIPLALIFMLCIMCITGGRMISRTETDLGTVYNSAWEIAENGKVSDVYTGNEKQGLFMESSNNDYFLRYSNNLPILFILSRFYKILAHLGFTSENVVSNFLSAMLNAVFILAGVLFGILAAKNIFGRKGAVAYTLLSLFFLPYYVNVSHFYTDTMSMPFVSLIMWIYSIDDRKFKSVYIKYILIGLVTGVGALIKGSILIVPVAIVIHCMLKSIKSLRLAVVTLIVTVFVMGLWSGYTNNCSWIDTEQSDRYAFPVTHWMMMGLNTQANGGYSQEDFEYTESYHTKAEKQQANINMIIHRLSSFESISDFGRFQFTKAASTWCDGLYMQEVHMDWALKKGGIYNALVKDREYNMLFNVYTVVYSFMLCIFATIGGVIALKRPETDEGMFLRLVMLGVILFFMIWETKSRYIFNFTPVFMLAAIWGLRALKRVKK